MAAAGPAIPKYTVPTGSKSVPPCGSGIAGGREPVSRSTAGTRPLGHRRSYRFANRGMARQELFRDSQDLVFLFIGVGDIAGNEIIRTAGRVGQPRGHHPACYTLGGGDGSVVLPQQSRDDGIQCVFSPLAIEAIAQQFRDRIANFAQKRIGFRFAVDSARGGEPTDPRAKRARWSSDWCTWYTPVR